MGTLGFATLEAVQQRVAILAETHELVAKMIRTLRPGERNSCMLGVPLAAGQTPTPSEVSIWPTLRINVAFSPILSDTSANPQCHATR